MSAVDVADTLFGALTVIAGVAAAGASWAAVSGRGRRLGVRVPLLAAFAVAATATAGSLWYSEVAGYVPCTLCWYQRIAIYPQTLLLGVAAWRSDAGVRWTAWPLAGVGAAVSTWHLQVERAGSSEACAVGASCAIRWVEAFGALTLPAMALVAQVAIVAFVALAARNRP